MPTGRAETDVKVGGHQASCASMAPTLTALWFNHMGGDEKVAVRPHASPVYHAMKYLTGELDRSYLPTLRQQAYPSRTKDRYLHLPGWPSTVVAVRIDSVDVEIVEDV